MGKFSNNWKRRNGNFLGFRSIIDIVCALEILGVVLFLVAPQFVMNYLILNPAAILHGQIWRIVTFLVYPPAITGSDAIDERPWHLLYPCFWHHCGAGMGKISL